VDDALQRRRVDCHMRQCRAVLVHLDKGQLTVVDQSHLQSHIRHWRCPPIALMVPNSMLFQIDSQNRSWLNRYVGAPFVSCGRTVAGLDCWGLVRLIYAQELGMELPSYGEISAHDLVRVSREITDGKDGDVWADVAKADLKAFDVVVMRYHGSRRIGHVGVLADATTMIHVEEASAAVVVPLAHFTIRERIACFRRHRFLA